MLPGWQSRSTQGTGHLQAPRPQHWCPDTCSCISYSRRQDTSGKKDASSEMGMARTAIHHQEGSSPKKERTVVHLYKGPTPLLLTPGSPPVAGKVVPSRTGARLLKQGDKPSHAVPVQTSQTTRWPPRSRQRLHQGWEKASQTLQLQVSTSNSKFLPPTPKKKS